MAVVFSEISFLDYFDSCGFNFGALSGAGDKHRATLLDCVNRQIMPELIAIPAPESIVQTNANRVIIVRNTFGISTLPSISTLVSISSNLDLSPDKQPPVVWISDLNFIFCTRDEDSDPYDKHVLLYTRHMMNVVSKQLREMGVSMDVNTFVDKIVAAEEDFDYMVNRDTVETFIKGLGTVNFVDVTSLLDYFCGNRDAVNKVVRMLKNPFPNL